ncbi:hypothetical protein BOS5A_170110 [Bosea sp. EC-HK365B]|nr:hypothetical protein BOSE21B_111041 [Bosea sp. 21B]VVT56747.1 hypothetical protein BOS5A_170110 [Bosea sp. EC-HK365B]VXC74222.1 hypothetical protein BOSE127_40351 [Bosea sp. 127]
MHARLLRSRPQQHPALVHDEPLRQPRQGRPLPRQARHTLKLGPIGLNQPDRIRLLPWVWRGAAGKAAPPCLSLLRRRNRPAA